jgi:uncharacterized DUF497 family protein
MADYRFWWDEVNLEHIAEHGVEPYEAEEVIDNAILVTGVGQGKHAAFGQSDGGRYLLVIFAKKSDTRLRVVTARDMTDAEKKRVKRRRK